ncbi:unnamed protein product, partial [Musa acuminata var. zebrina]
DCGSFFRALLPIHGDGDGDGETDVNGVDGAPSSSFSIPPCLCHRLLEFLILHASLLYTILTLDWHNHVMAGA